MGRAIFSPAKRRLPYSFEPVLDRGAIPFEGELQGKPHKGEEEDSGPGRKVTLSGMAEKTERGRPRTDADQP